MNLPRAYWCHVTHPDDSPCAVKPGDWTTEAPGQVLDWIRDSVRETFPALDRDAFGRAWAWLGDHHGAAAAVRELRRGRPYVHALSSPAGTYTWTAHLVSVLPVLDLCPNSPSRAHELTPRGAAAPPP